MRARRDHCPLNIDGSSVEVVKSTRFLGVHLVENLSWSLNNSSITTKAQQRFCFLWKLGHLPPSILTTFYRGTIESVLSSRITVWYGNCTVSDCKTLQLIVRAAEKIIGASLPSIIDTYLTRSICKATSIVEDPTHTLHPAAFWKDVPSRLRNSFFPQTVRLLNTRRVLEERCLSLLCIEPLHTVEMTIKPLHLISNIHLQLFT